VLVDIVRVLAVTLAVPLAFVITVWFSRPVSRGLWLVQLMAAASYLAWIVVTGRWDWVSYPLRFVFPLLLIGAAIRSYLRMRDRAWWSSGRPGWTTLASNAGVTVLFLVMLAITLPGINLDGAEPVRLSFPLEDGVWYVAHGGDSSQLNYHHGARSQRYAIDLTRLGPLGTRAAGAYPSELASYYAFDTPVRSPCSGTVVTATEDLPDLAPGEADRENPAGNHVIVRCQEEGQGVDVVLAHLRRDSVLVEPNQVVAAGDLVGRVGNSGNTSEPHLHIHAIRTGSGDMRDGEPVPLTFADRFLIRNDLVDATG
jgi:hypothetical protein